MTGTTGSQNVINLKDAEYGGQCLLNRPREYFAGELHNEHIVGALKRGEPWIWAMIGPWLLEVAGY